MNHPDAASLGTAYFAALLILTVVFWAIALLPDKYLFRRPGWLRNTLAILGLTTGALAFAYFAWQYLPYSPTPGG